jgi:hypothetical protein
MLLEIRDLQRRHAKNTNTSIANLGHNEPLEQTFRCASQVSK